MWYGWLVVALALLAAGAVRADEQAEAKALIDKAIKAAGGKAPLDKAKAVVVKGKGKVEVGKEVPFTLEVSVQGFDQGRMDLVGDVDGVQHKVLLVINGAKGWVNAKDRVEDVPAELLAALKADARALRLAQMLVPLGDKAITLSPLGEVKINDQPAVGVKVVQKGQTDFNLYFDKKTGLPVKCELQVKDGGGGQEVAHEFFFADYKEAGGVKHFTKITFHRDGKKMIEAELSEVTPEDKLDDSLFAKPE
jgi:hypothetical protein